MGEICEWGLSVQHGVISAVRVIRGLPCGASWWVASQLISTLVVDAPDKAGLSVQQYPCRAVRGIRGGIHRLAEIHKKACGWRWRQVLIGCILHALLFVSVCVQVQKGILTPCKRLITTQSYSIAKKRYGRRLRAYRIYE